MANNPQQSIINRIGSEVESFGNNLVSRVKQQAIDTVGDTGFGKALRALNILPGANPSSSQFTSATWDTGTNGDWRVRLSIPKTSAFTSSVLLGPLIETNGLVFPYTPNVYISHSANYDTLQPTHSNYPFRIYQNSAIDSMTITGDFTVENAREAEYWIGAVHYLKSVTKMAYGNSSNKGSPPPVVLLNGYGDYVFKNVPVVIQQFNFQMPPEVDYIEAPLGGTGSWVPTQSQLSVTLLPTYSRDKVNRFSLDSFVAGDYLFDDDAGYL